METAEIHNTDESIEVLSHDESDLGFAVVEREKMMVDGNNSFVTTVRSTSLPELIYDTDIEEKGIITEPGSLLIDQNATALMLQRKAGKKPEEYVHGISGSGLVLPGNHFGWQEGAFLIKDGKIITIANDESLSGQFDVFGQRDGKWGIQSVGVQAGDIVEEDQSGISEMRVGMSGPSILKESEIIPLRAILGDPRIQADSRNLVDYAAGISVPGEFFQDIRKISPSVPRETNRLVREKPASVVTRALVPKSEDERAPFERLKEAIDAGKLPHMRMDIKDGYYRLGIFGKLPEQKLPIMGYGNDADGNLIVVAVDGRQEESAGASISQLARVMKEKGATDAILACAGGDVAVVEKNENEYTLLNSPANKDADGSRVTRPIPSVMVLR